ncbi:response regulator [Xanthomonas citri pv. punicae str. LMG 859]|nr:response regulator [Xanthomonas citri pv. punicae str. LMG 859]
MRVLLVNDTEKPIGELRRALTRAGYQVLDDVASVGALLHAVQRQQPDVVVIDVDSPSRDTLEQLSMLHAHAPRPVVMFSGDGEDALIHAAVGAGVTAYVVDGLAPARLRPSCRWRWPVLRRKAAGAAGPQADRPREGLADGKTWPERGRCLCGITPAGDEAGRQTDRSGAPYRGHGRIQPGLGRAACRLRTRARCHVDRSPGRRVASAGRRGCA